jgi:hypothetical protein
MNFDGALRILRDVTVRERSKDDFTAISRERAVPGEVLTLSRVVAGATVSVRVRVTDSRPVVVGGTVRHRLRLRRLASTHAHRPSA